jgi:hypothetical protein
LDNPRSEQHCGKYREGVQLPHSDLLFFLISTFTQLSGDVVAVVTVVGAAAVKALKFKRNLIIYSRTLFVHLFIWQQKTDSLQLLAVRSHPFTLE